MKNIQNCSEQFYKEIFPGTRNGDSGIAEEAGQVE